MYVCVWCVCVRVCACVCEGVCVLCVRVCVWVRGWRGYCTQDKLRRMAWRRGGWYPESINDATNLTVK